jgi:hemerythrin superfamily protein
MTSKASRPAAKKASGSTRADPATKLLMADHKEVHAMFQQYKKLADAGAEASEREALATEICHALTVHATVEEELFYPAAREAELDADLLDEAEVEHASAKELIAQIEAMSPGDDLYDAKVTVLGEYIDHHVKEEEEELFPKCRKSAMDLEGLGEAMSTRKAELTAEMDEMAT